MGIRIDHIAKGAQRGAVNRGSSKRANRTYGTQPPPAPQAQPPLKAEDGKTRRTAGSSRRS